MPFCEISHHFKYWHEIINQLYTIWIICKSKYAQSTNLVQQRKRIIYGLDLWEGCMNSRIKIMYIMYQKLNQIILCDKKHVLPTKQYVVSSPLKCISHTQSIINIITTLHPFNLISKYTIKIHYIYYESFHYRQLIWTQKWKKIADYVLLNML